jgi:hypothetical protein
VEMHGRRGSRNTLLAGSHVRGDDQRFGELIICAGYTPPRNNRVVYPNAVYLYRDERYTPPRNNRVVYPTTPHILLGGWYTPPRNNRVVYRNRPPDAARYRYTPPRNNRVVYLLQGLPVRGGWYTPPRNNRVVYPAALYLPILHRYTPPRNNRVVYRWTLCYHCRDGEDNVQSLHTFSVAVSYSATSHRAFSTCL